MPAPLIKHIVIIGPAYPLRGGLASYDERLATEFLRKGYKTTIFTFSLQYPGFLFPGTTQYSTEPPPAGIKIEVCINSINPLNWLMVGNRLKILKPDIIVVRYWLPFMGPCLGTILRRVKSNAFTSIVCIADNIIPHEKRAGDLIFTKYFIKPVHAFITMSEQVLCQLRKLAPAKPARYVPHPLYDNFGEPVSVKEARAHLNLPQNEIILLFFGFIRKYKGLDILLRAMKILKEKSGPSEPRIRLLVAGEFYDDATLYTNLVRDLSIQNDLVLKTDFIPDSEVKYYFCAADCVVQPYRQATQSGVTPLAYHFNIPMIVTNVGGLPALVPDKKSGLIAEPNPADIAEKILDFVQFGKEYFLPFLSQEKLKYSWSVMVNAILQSATITSKQHDDIPE